MKKVTDSFFVSSQITVEDIPDIAKQGFSTIVCNRPNHEEIGQTDYQMIELCCAQNNLKFINLPMSPGHLTSDLIDQTYDLINEENKTFAYCRTGTRCITLWACANVKLNEVSETLDQVNQAGYDLDHLQDFLEDIKAS